MQDWQKEIQLLNPYQVYSNSPYLRHSVWTWNRLPKGCKEIITQDCVDKRQFPQTLTQSSEISLFPVQAWSSFKSDLFIRDQFLKNSRKPTQKTVTASWSISLASRKAFLREDDFLEDRIQRFSACLSKSSVSIKITKLMKGKVGNYCYSYNSNSKINSICWLHCVRNPTYNASHHTLPDLQHCRTQH